MLAKRQCLDISCLQLPHLAYHFGIALRNLAIVGVQSLVSCPFVNQSLLFGRRLSQAMRRCPPICSSEGGQHRVTFQQRFASALEGGGVLHNVGNLTFNALSAGILICKCSGTWLYAFFLLERLAHSVRLMKCQQAASV